MNMGELDNGAQYIKVVFEGAELMVKIGGHLTKTSLSIIKNLVKAFNWMYKNKTYGKEIGGTNIKNLMKKDKNVIACEIPKDNIKYFEKTAKQLGILYTKMPDLEKNSPYYRIMLHAKNYPRAQQIMTYINEQNEKRITSDAMDKVIKKDQKHIEKAKKKLEGLTEEEITNDKKMMKYRQIIIENTERMERWKIVKDKGGLQAKAIGFDDYINSADSEKYIDEVLEHMSDDDSSKKISEKKTTINKLFENEQEQDLDEVKVVVSNKNLKNYIVITKSEEMYNKHLYVNTDYQVFIDDKEVKSDEFEHGRFTHYSRHDGGMSDSAGKIHWENLQSEIKEKVGIKGEDELLEFKNVEELEKYRNEAEKKNELEKIRIVVDREKIQDENEKAVCIKAPTIDNEHKNIWISKKDVIEEESNDKIIKFDVKKEKDFKLYDAENNKTGEIMVAEDLYAGYYAASNKEFESEIDIEDLKIINKNESSIHVGTAKELENLIASSEIKIELDNSNLYEKIQIYNPEQNVMGDDPKNNKIFIRIDDTYSVALDRNKCFIERGIKDNTMSIYLDRKKDYPIVNFNENEKLQVSKCNGKSLVSIINKTQNEASKADKVIRLESTAEIMEKARGTVKNLAKGFTQ